jgi:hypothetical protein
MLATQLGVPGDERIKVIVCLRIEDKGKVIVCLISLF